MPIGGSWPWIQAERFDGKSMYRLALPPDVLTEWHVHLPDAIVEWNDMAAVRSMKEIVDSEED